MNIQAGKTYLNRRGDKVTVEDSDQDWKDAGYPFITVSVETGDSICTVTEEGQQVRGTGFHRGGDLVPEVIDTPLLQSKLKFNCEGNPELYRAIIARLMLLTGCNDIHSDQHYLYFDGTRRKPKLTFGWTSQVFSDHENTEATLLDLYDIPPIPEPKHTVALDGKVIEISDSDYETLRQSLEGYL